MVEELLPLSRQEFNLNISLVQASPEHIIMEEQK
jgi:hypothetical protein